MNDVTVCIPTIPPRSDLLVRALVSVANQTCQAQAIHVACDCDRKGAGPTRTRAMMAASTEWVAFLDDDDELKPEHLEVLLDGADEFDADVVWPWYDVHGGQDPLRLLEGRQWNRDHPHQFPITCLVRTELAHATGGFSPPIHPSAQISGEDFPFFVKLNEMGAKFIHINRRTWVWHHHSKNTSGMPNRW